MDKIRAEEEAAFSQKKKDLEQGIQGVRMASKVLREHYSNAAALLQLSQQHSGSPKKASTALVQQRMSPVIPDDSQPVVNPTAQPPVNPELPVVQPPVNPELPVVQPPVLPIIQPPMPDDSYSPSTEAGKSILDMLDLIESDFMKDLAEANAGENQAKREYQKDSLMNKLDKEQKESDITHKGKEATNLDKMIAELSSDREGVRDELDAILQYLKTLEASCIAKAETYEERARRREAEIAGLKEALSILQGEALLQTKFAGLRGARKIDAGK